MTRLRFLPPVTLACLLVLSAPGVGVPEARGGSPETARGRMSPVAEDGPLAAWQREFMRQMAAPDSAQASEDEALPLAASAETASDGRWIHGPEPPVGRSLHAAVYDPIRQRMLVFGGYSRARGVLDELWALSLRGSPRWTRLEVAGEVPPARHLYSAVYDPVRDRVVIFGGMGRTSVLNDVWVLSLAGAPRWTRLEPLGIPPAPRTQHSAIYDAHGDCIYVFGGAGRTHEGVVLSRLNDVWALSLSGRVKWRLVSPEGTPPNPRFGQAAVLDGRGRMVLFGGYDGAMVHDVWALSLNDRPRWQQLSPDGEAPPPRLQHSAVYDPVSGRMMVFGGQDEAMTIFDDAWALSLRGRLEWKRLEPSATPVRRAGQSAILDARQGQVVLYGGTADGWNLSDEVWSVSCATNAWTKLELAAPPAPRFGESAIFDPTRRRMVMFGGYGYNSGTLADVWTLSLADGTGWTPLRPDGDPPPAREAHSAIYDVAHDRMVVFGGLDVMLSTLNDAWALSFSGTPTWTRLETVGGPPPARRDHTAIDDPQHDRMVVFGGVGEDYLGDVWALSLSGVPTWTQLVPQRDDLARFEHSAILDSTRGRMIVFGGLYGLDAHNDLWALSLGDSPGWSPLAPAGALPPGSADHSAIYDPQRDRMVVFPGGYAGTWALDLAGSTTWIPLHPEGASLVSSAPQVAAFDPIGDRMAVFASSIDGNETWELCWGPPEAPTIRPPVTSLHRSAEFAPSKPAFLLAGARPNPSRLGPRVVFSLPDAAPARLDVIDVSGRRLLSREVGGLGPGEHTLDLAQQQVFPPGLYLMRLTRGNETRTARAVVIR
jgi:hypothetical protein